jgi:hypothetical protein
MNSRKKTAKKAGDKRSDAITGGASPAFRQGWHRSELKAVNA